MALKPPQSITFSQDDWQANEAAYASEIEARTKAQDQLSEMTIAFNQAVKERDTAIAGEAAERLTRQKTQQALTASVEREKVLQREVSDLTDQLIEARKPPVSPPPAPRARVITKTQITGVAGICIAKDNAPSLAQDDASRALITLAASLGFNAWRGFFNLQEVKTHGVLSEDSPKHLPAFGRKLDMAFVADTVNWAAVNLNDADLKIYIAGLIKMGAMAFYFDDANQYREAKNADGSLKYPAGTLEKLVGRIRALAPEIPLIASLTANALIATYKPLFDHVEAQTFGKITELGTFLARDFDVFCLDGRPTVTLDYVTKSADIILRSDVDSFFYYPETLTGWKSMGAQTAVIKTLIDRWKLL